MWWSLWLLRLTLLHRCGDVVIRDQCNSAYHGRGYTILIVTFVMFVFEPHLSWFIWWFPQQGFPTAGGSPGGRRLVLYVHTRAVEWAPLRWWPMLRFWDQPKNEVIADHCNDETYHVMLWPIMWWRDQWYNVESNHAMMRSILWWILRPNKDDDSKQVIIWPVILMLSPPFDDETSQLCDDETKHMMLIPIMWWWSKACEYETSHVIVRQIMEWWYQSCDVEDSYRKWMPTVYWCF